MKVSFKEWDLLLFPINLLSISVHNLNSSYLTRLLDYFLFQILPHIPHHFISLYFYYV
jgi:hypothetical protein